jgi:hypothetical protein
MMMRWYVVHALGFEKRVQRNLLDRINVPA